MALLAKVALEPETTLTSCYEALDLHPAHGRRLVTGLEAAGLVRRHAIPRRGRGGRPTVLEVLPAGAALLVARDIEPAARVLKGGFRHDLFGRFVRRWATTQGLRVAFERTLGPKTFDIVTTAPSGCLTGIEICCSGSVSWNYSQLRKAATVAGLSIWVVSDDKTLLSTLHAKTTDNRISFHHISDFTP